MIDWDLLRENIYEAWQDHLVRAGYDYDKVMDVPVTDEFVSDYMLRHSYTEDEILDALVKI